MRCRYSHRIRVDIIATIIRALAPGDKKNMQLQASTLTRQETNRERGNVPEEHNERRWVEVLKQVCAMEVVDKNLSEWG